ncbi:MAG: TetR/AcrR family transcriptional regulator, partial [Myxococcota bacterium]
MSSRTTGPGDPTSRASGRAKKKAAVRRRILESAKEVFFRDGFMDANLDEVAERADVAKGTLYRYFENKAQLYVAVLSHKGKVFEEKLKSALDPDAPPDEALWDASRFYLQ